MRRPAAISVASIERRLRGLAGYLAYRSFGCGHDEAVALTRAEVAGEQPVRLCRSTRLSPESLPPRNETMSFGLQFESELRRASTGEFEPTHVDREGEIVWVQEYAQERLAGRSHAEATESVLARIRTLAP
jgi:hypothetical protein